MQPAYYIRSFYFDAEKKVYFINLIHSETQKLETYPACLLSRNKSLINKFSSEDANRIGYMAGISDNL